MGIHFENLNSNITEFDLECESELNSNLSLKYNILTDENNDSVGYVEGYVSENNVFISVVRIAPSYQGKGYGYDAFNKVFQELNRKKSISKICGNWHKDEEFSDCDDGMSTNLKIFIVESKNNSDLSECAFKTPTGKWAKKLGFDNCNVLRNTENTVELEFTKKK